MRHHPQRRHPYATVFRVICAVFATGDFNGRIGNKRIFGRFIFPRRGALELTRDIVVNLRLVCDNHAGDGVITALDRVGHRTATRGHTLGPHVDMPRRRRPTISTCRQHQTHKYPEIRNFPHVVTPFVIFIIEILFI